MAKDSVKLIYTGPGEKVNVAPFGTHMIGEKKEYPLEAAHELMKTSSKQKFETANGKPLPPLPEPEPEDTEDPEGGKDPEAEGGRQGSRSRGDGRRRGSWRGPGNREVNREGERERGNGQRKQHNSKGDRKNERDI